jgi:hypothetical protein
MKRIVPILVLLFTTFAYAQNVGINSTGAAPNASAVLDVDAAPGNDKGLLIPRIALLAINNALPITAPANSLVVYNTATAGIPPNNVVPGFYFWNGTKWIAFGGSGGMDWSLTGNAGTAPGTNFIGTTDAIDFAIFTNNTEKVRVISAGNVGIGIVSPDTSALLEVNSTKKGVLIPRVALVSSNDAVTIAAPATSLLVYNLGTAGLAPAGYYYNSGTTLAPVWVRFITTTTTQTIPTAQYPTFDAISPYLLLGALWVGYDATANCWKYNKQAAGRGVVDPGDPNTWVVNGTTINYFNGNLNKLPSGTHINNRYDPETMAAKYSQDDIMVKTGSYWTDKFESRIIDVSNGSWQDNDDNTILTPSDGDIRGNGQGIPPTWMSFSQKNFGSSGMSWFVAQQAALNSGKRLLTNAEWQGAAAGTARTDATGMTINGENWSVVADMDISRFGIVGMVGSLWEWVADWGQYGPDSGIGALTLKDQGVAYGNDGAQNIAGIANTSNLSVGGGSVAGIPAALVRGGTWSNTTAAGVFDMNANNAPSYWAVTRGFRCAR